MYLEYASTGRAVCQVGECKKNKVKIGKGELRLGVWVDMGDFASWRWRHYGCATPQVVKNIETAIDGDYDMLDGYEDLTVEDQGKIQQAIQNGHIADEDCVSVVG